MFLFWINFSQPVNGQRAIYQKFTVEDGLPSNTIYQISQDSKGYIWLATGTGASRFNGTDFKNFDGSNGLDDIFGLIIDPLDRVWFWDNNTYFSYYWQGEIHHTDTIPYLNNKISNLSNTIIIDTSAITIVTKEMELVKVDIKTLAILKVIPKSEHKISKDYIYPHMYKYIDYPPNHFSDKYFCSEDFTFQFHSRIMQTGVYKSKENLHWIINSDGTGLNLTEERDSCFTVIKTILKDKKINCVYEDPKGGLWIGSRNEGLFFLPNRSVISYDKKEGLSANPCYSIEKDEKGRIFIGNDISKIDIIDSNNHSISNIKLTDKSVKIYDLNYDKKKYLWVISEAGAFVIDEDKIYNTGTPNKKYKADKAIFSENDSIHWIGSSNYLYKCFLDTENKAVDFHNIFGLEKKMKTYAIYGYKDTLWLGTARGLLRYHFTEKDTIEYNYGKQNKLLSVGIRDIERYKNKFWIATVNKGLLILENDSLILHINKDTHAIGSNSCTELHFDSLRNSMWLAGKNGITRITNLDDLNNLKFKIYNAYDGLIGNEATDVLVDDNGYTWVTTKSGVTKFKVEDLNKNTNPKILVTNVSIWGKDTILQNHYNLPPNKNDIGFMFESIYFNSPIKYKYKLFGRDEDWTITKNNQVRYSRLPSGDYKFEVLAINEELVESKESAIIEFSIGIPFWKQKWFILLSICTILLATYLIVKYRINQIKRESQLTELSLRGIRNQMNAHFLFNALNSIQSYVLKSDAKTAYHFLTKLSRLIRQTLYHSNQKNIPLLEEVNLLTNYMDLEKMRLEEAINYEVNIDPKLENKNINIQPLILQPYIENSIRWGLKDINTKGLITINVNLLKNNYLEFIIKDNGIGRKKAAEVKSKYFQDHKSMGTDINVERMKLLTDTQKKVFSAKTEDLYNEKMEATGTKVTVTMPIEE